MNDYDVPALGRAERVLEVIAASGPPVRAAEITRATGLSKSTAYVLLESLLRRRWIERSGDGYVIGVRLFELARGYVRSDGLIDAFRAAATDFIQQHNEVVQMAVLDGAQVIYVAREDARRPVQLVSEVGSRLPAHCSALGRALLASHTDAEVQALLPATLEPLTQRTVTDPGALLQLLRKVRVDGFAVESGEISTGLRCIAAYVGETASGRRMAVSTSAPIDRLDRMRGRQLATAIVDVARRIGTRIALLDARAPRR